MWYHPIFILFYFILLHSAYPMCPLYGPYQVDSLPDIDVPIQGTGVCNLIPGTCHTEDGLELACPPKHTTFRGQSIPTQTPELSR